jgi:hypothetical protein
MVTHYFSPVRSPNDSPWTVNTALSILHEGNVDLDEYRAEVSPRDGAALDVVSGHSYDAKSFVVGILSVPIVAVVDLAFPALVGEPLDDYTRRHGGVMLEGMIATLLIATSSVLVLLIGREAGLDNAVAWALGGIFAFCTTAWSVGSRQLWEYGPSMFLLTAGLLAIMHARRQPAVLPVAGVALALAALIRPSNAIVIGVLAAYVLWRYRRRSAGFVLAGLLTAAPFVALSASIYGAVAPLSLLPAIAPASAWPGTLLSNLIDPGRGMFVQSPLFAVAVLGVVLKFRSGRWTALDSALVIAIVAQLIFMSMLDARTDSRRATSDLVALWIVFLAPVMQSVITLPERRRRLVTAAVVVLAVLSFGIHYLSANSSQVASADTIIAIDSPIKLIELLPR